MTHYKGIFYEGAKFYYCPFCVNGKKDYKCAVYVDVQDTRLLIYFDLIDTLGPVIDALCLCQKFILREDRPCPPPYADFKGKIAQEWGYDPAAFKKWREENL